MRSDHQTRGLHFFNVYALRDRIDFCGLDNAASLIAPDEINLDVLIPSEEDYEVLLSNFSTLVTRIILQNVPEVQCPTSQVEWHIEHQYSDEMSTKSEVV